MAEGGNSCHRDTSSPDTGSHSLESRLLECPICLENLRQPKLLPCFHSFCQDCLCTFITKEPPDNMSLSFSCPVCRTAMQPIDPSEKRENWARQFPTESLYQELIQLKKTSTAPHYCKPCRKKGIMESPAQSWCKSADMLFCEACKFGIHDIMHEQCDALVTVGTDAVIPRETPAGVQCSKHKKKVDYYCEDHKILGCCKCIIVDRRPCKVVTTTEEYCETLNTSSKTDNLCISLQTSADTIGILMKDFSEQIQTLVNQQDTGLKTIRELRKQIDQCLDRMEKELTDELITAVKQEKENIEVTLRQCKQLQTSIFKTLESSKSATLKNDNVETILLYQRGQMEVETCKDLVTEMRKIYTPVNVRHVIDPGLKTIGKDTKLNLGEILLENQTKYLPGRTKYSTSSFSDRRVKEIVEFSIKTTSDSENSDATGVIYLPSNHVIVGDYNSKNLKLFTDKGQYLDELMIEGDPWDICMVDNNAVAVAVSSPGSVLVVSMQSSKMSLLYSLEGPDFKNCYGITYINGKFVVSTPKQVYEMTEYGMSDLLHTLPTECYSLTSYSKHGYVYASQQTHATGDTAVYRLSHDAKTDIIKVGVVKGVWGVDMDQAGNVFICGRESNKVVQISGDGRNVRELLTLSDGVQKPQAIAVCGDRFVVTTLGERNSVRIYQLL